MKHKKIMALLAGTLTGSGGLFRRQLGFDAG